jgi:transcriptional regulator with XRE-family HTH domain
LRRLPPAWCQSRILDFSATVHYTGLMNLAFVGRLVAERRRAGGLTLTSLAAAARVGRSTLAALESGSLPELGYGRVARICEAVGLVLEARPLVLEKPLAAHRHITETAGRELTKAAMEDLVLRGDIDAWRGLVAAVRADGTGRLARRAREVLAGADRTDGRVRAFAALLPGVLKKRGTPDVG